MSDDKERKRAAAKARAIARRLAQGSAVMRVRKYKYLGTGAWFAERHPLLFPGGLPSTPAAKALVAERQAGKRVPTGKLLKELAAAKLFHLDFYARPDRALIRLLDIAAAQLSSKTEWQREQVAAQKSDAVRNRNRIRAEADRVRAEHPGWNNIDVAYAVIEALDGKLTRRGKDGKIVPVKLKHGTVRRQISQSE